VTATATAPPPAGADNQSSTAAGAGAPSWLAIALPAVVLAIAAAFILDAGRGTTFFYDEWIWIMQRRSPGTASLLEPFNNHLMALPIATYQLMYRVFGLGSQGPYRAVLLVGHLATCALLYGYLRSRVGWIVGLAGAAALAFFGYTWPVIIWPISLGWVYATTAGIAALLLVDRDSRPADVSATAALVIGVASSGIAVPFVLGLTAELALRRAWHRIYVALVPLVLFGAWYLGYGTGTNDRGTVGQILDFAEKLLAQTVGTLLGVDDRGTAAHVALVVVAILLIALWLLLGRPHSPRLVGNAIALASFTALLSYSRATSGLTQWHSYAAAVFVLLTVGELLAGRSFGVIATAAVGIVVVWSIVWNLGQLSDGAELQRSRADDMRAQLAAVDLGGPLVDPEFRPGPLFLETHAGPYLEVAAEYGSPAYSLAELREASAHARRSADVALVGGIGLRLAPAPADPSCIPVEPSADGTVVVHDRAPSLSIAASRRPAVVRAGAFADPGALVGRVRPGHAATLEAPRLPRGVRWTVRVTSDAAVRVCTSTSHL
jgi:hypothetical protein